MDKDGQNRRRITRNLGTDRYAAWCPDGNFLIYTSAHPKSASERLAVIDIEKMKTSKVDFDRRPLDYEIDVESQRVYLYLNS